MADPQIKFKRSSVALKRPSLDNVATGEFAINVYDGNLFTRVDTGGVGIATTVSNLTPWTENFGGESITYTGIETSGGGVTTDFSSVTLSGLTPTGFNTTYTRQSNGFVLDTGTVASGNALFDTDSSYYYYVEDGDNSRMLIFSESDNSWVGVASTGSSPSTEYNVLTTSGLSPSSFNQTYTRQATGFILDTGTVASGNAIFRTDSSHYYYVASTGSDAEDRIVIWSEEDNAWLTVFDFNDPDFREGNISNGQALGSSFIFNATLATASDTFNGRNVPDADDANVTYDTTRDYTSITLDAGISDFDGDYTRQSFKANLDTGTVSSDNALFNATSDYWWFLKDGDNSKMIIFDSVAGFWTYVGKTGADFSSAANNTAVGEVNMVESQTLASVAYESSAYQPDANHSEITYAALSGANYTSVSNNDALGAGTTFVSVTSGKTTADSRFVPTASGTIVYGTSNVAVSTSRVGVVTFTTDGNLVLSGTVDGRDIATDGSNQDNLVTLTGVGIGSTHLGTFTGTTISDNEDIKTALQDLETALDNVVGGNSGAASVLVSSTDTDASFFPTFVADNNNSDTQETFKTDAGITYNPSTNILTVSGSVAANVTGNLTGDVTGTATTATNLADAANITTGTISNDRLPSTITKDLTGDVTGNVTGNATSADTVDVTDASSTNDTFNPVFSDGSGSGETIMMDVGLIYNPSSNTLTAGTFSGSLSGTADVADNVDVVNVSTSDLDLTLTMSDGSNTTTGRTLGMDSDLTYNPSTNTLTAGTVVGNLTGDVTGTASTATHAVQLQTSRNIGGVAFNGTADINLPGVNAAGNQNTSGTAAGLSGSPSITVTDITAVGNVSIAGTLTYEDVTSIDAVGLITARTGVRVTTGGIVVSAGGLEVTGVTTLNDNLDLQDNDKILIGTGDDLQIYHDGNHSYIDDAGTGNLRLRSGTIELTNLAGSKTSATFNSASGQEFYFNNTKRLETTSTGSLVSGILTATSFSGPLTGNVTGNLVGNVTGDITGTATTATNLADGANITTGTISNDRLPSTITKDITGDVTGNLTGNVVGNVTGDVTGTATTATNLANAANITTGTISNDRLPATITKNLTGDVTGNVSGNAGTATSLATARTIAGVSFDGTSNISLNNNAITNGAGYITTSFTNTNQLTNGAGYITASDDITGTASFFNVTSNNNTDEILFPLFVDGTSGSQGGEVDSSITWNPSTNILRIADPTGGFNGVLTGTATTATHAVQLQTARNIGGVSFNGTADINLPGVNAAGNQNTSGTAAGLSGSPSITVTDITAVGNVSIAGTLTYEDVTSVDSIGIVTARSGVRVTTGGLTVSAGGANITGGITGDLTGDVTGNVSGNAGTATSLATARTIAGVSFDGTSNISLNNNAITNGAGYITTSLTSYDDLTDKPTIPTNNNQLSNGAGYITTSFTNTNQLTNGAGFITNNVSGVLTATQFKGDGSTLSNIPTSIVAGDNISVSGATGAVTITGLANTSNVRTDTLNVTGVSTFSGNVSLGDNVKINVGDSNDLQIYHDGSHSYIQDAGQGNLKFCSNNFKFSNGDDSKTSILATPPGGVELYWNNTKRLETLNGGVNIVGTCTATAFVGDGSGLTNIGVSTSNVRSDTVQVGVLTATSQFYPPSLTTAERDAITFSTGAFIFNSTEQRLQVYLGTTWASLTVDIDPYSIINM